jgi:hypothetical protein
VLVLIFLPILDGLAYLIAHGQSIPSDRPPGPMLTETARATPA